MTYQPPPHTRLSTVAVAVVPDHVACPDVNRCRVVLLARRYATYLVGLLCHTDPTAATSYDLVARGVMPYPLVVQADLPVTLLPHQVTRTLAELPEPLRVAVGNVAATDGRSLHAVGQFPVPLAGPTDRRWQFKKDEGEAASALSAAALEVLLG